jgi:RNA polymerase-binding transcription factor DksA
MEALTKKDIDQFAKVLAERKQRLGGDDAGDTSVADLLSDVAFAEVARDAAEIRDINAAQARIAAGTYGACIDCGRPIGKQRLEAYPTAKRCIEDQQRREKLRAGPPHPRT